jgi:hypothetical protein
LHGTILNCSPEIQIERKRKRGTMPSHNLLIILCQLSDISELAVCEYRFKPFKSGGTFSTKLLVSASLESRLFVKESLPIISFADGLFT